MLPTPAMNQSKRELSQYGWRPADPARWPVLFVNPGSGDGKAAHARVAEWARDKGIEAVILAPGQDLAALAGEAVAAGADALGMAGGDGSLAVVAASTPELTATGATQPAAVVRYPAGGAAGPDLLAPPGRLASSAPAPPRPPPRSQSRRG